MRNRADELTPAGFERPLAGKCLLQLVRHVVERHGESTGLVRAPRADACGQVTRGQAPRRVRERPEISGERAGDRVREGDRDHRGEHQQQR